MGFNEAQAQAIQHTDGPCLVLAGPGSGKTLTIVNRVKYLIEKQKERLEKLNKDILDMLGTIVEFRNLESGEHIMRVKGYTKILAEKFKELYPAMKPLFKNL